MSADDKFWLAVLIVSLVGGFCVAAWYAKRQKASYEDQVMSSTPQNFVPGSPHNGLPHVWTFANGDRVYADAVITRFGAREVRLADGSILKSSGSVSLRASQRDWSLIVIGRGRTYVKIIRDSVVVSGDLTVG